MYVCKYMCICMYNIYIYILTIYIYYMYIYILCVYIYIFTICIYKYIYYVYIAYTGYICICEIHHFLSGSAVPFTSGYIYIYISILYHRIHPAGSRRQVSVSLAFIRASKT